MYGDRHNVNLIRSCLLKEKWSIQYWVNSTIFSANTLLRKNLKSHEERFPDVLIVIVLIECNWDDCVGSIESIASSFLSVILVSIAAILTGIKSNCQIWCFRPNLKIKLWNLMFSEIFRIWKSNCGNPQRPLDVPSHNLSSSLSSTGGRIYSDFPWFHCLFRFSLTHTDKHSWRRRA